MQNVPKQLLSNIDHFIPPNRRVYPPGHPKEGQPRAKRFFTYSAPFVVAKLLGPAGSATGTQQIGIAIQADSDFLILNLNRVVTNNAGTTFFAAVPATITLLDTGGGNQLMDNPLHVEGIAGTGQQPGILPFPYFMSGSSVLQVSLTNLDTVNSYAVWVSFPGVKIF